MSDIYMEYFKNKLKNKLDEVVEFKFYIDGIEEAKITEFEEIEKKYYESTNDVYEPVEFNFFNEYWKEWWIYNSNNFFDFMKKQHNILKTEDSITSLGLEVNEIVKDSKVYQILYAYDAVNDTRIIININIQRICKQENEHNEENKYDIDLENIKMDIKNFWIKTLKEREKKIGQDIVSYKCVWIEDTQSITLSNEAYREINIIENKLRNFINAVLSNGIGVKWNEIFEKTIIGNKFLSRKANYRESIKSFSNIDDFLLLIDSDDLYKIMNYHKNTVIVNDDKEELSILLEEIKCEKNPSSYIEKTQRFINKIEQNYIVKSKSIWDMYFSNLFDIKNKYEDISRIEKDLKSDFREKWQELCKYRNHIAHNKFIDSNFYNDLKKLIVELKFEMDEAQKEFIIQLEDEKNSSSWYYNLEFVSKKDREKIIHKQLLDLTCDIANEFKDNDKNVKIEKGFRHYVNGSIEFNDEFVLFVSNVRSSIKAMKILEVDLPLKKIVLQVTKKRGELCSYLVEFLVNEECIERTEIAHDGYGFCCDGYCEINGSDDNSEYYRNVIGQSWDYWRDYERNIINCLKEILNKNL